MSYVKVKLSKACSERGADMGRPDIIPEQGTDGNMPPRLRLVRLRWVDGDYDSGGAYWGGGDEDFIYRAFGRCNMSLSDPEGEEIEIFVRAEDRKQAKAKIREKIAAAKFVRLKSSGHARYAPANQFMVAYITAALWASTDDDGDPLDENYDGKPGEFGPGIWNQIAEQCKKFEEENADDIAAGAAVVSKYSDVSLAGHDFFLTRNGHGAGFWDGDWPEAAGKRMTAAAKKFGEMNLYIGDDKKLYF